MAVTTMTGRVHGDCKDFHAAGRDFVGIASQNAAIKSPTRKKAADTPSCSVQKNRIAEMARQAIAMMPMGVRLLTRSGSGTKHSLSNRMTLKAGGKCEALTLSLEDHRMRTSDSLVLDAADGNSVCKMEGVSVGLVVPFKGKIRASH